MKRTLNRKIDFVLCKSLCIGTVGLLILVIIFICYVFGVNSSDEFASIAHPPRDGTLEIIQSMTRPVVLLLSCLDEICISDLFTKLNLNSYCRDFPFPVDVVLGVKFLGDVTISLPDCHNIHFIKDPPLPEGTYMGASERLEDFENVKRRVERISFIREFFRSQVRILYSDESSQPSHIVLIDADMYLLPHPSSMLNSIAAIQSGKWQAICANGFQFYPDYHGRMYYDTFALLETNEKDDYNHGVDRLPYSQIDRREFYERVIANGIFEVKSCFGGAAVYHFDTYMTPECHYYSPAQNYYLCEHRRILRCFREERGAKVGVDGEFMLQYVGPYPREFLIYQVSSILFHVRLPILLIGCGAIIFAIRLGYSRRRYLPFKMVKN